jgi:hypothetical protein
VGSGRGRRKTKGNRTGWFGVGVVRKGRRAENGLGWSTARRGRGWQGVWRKMGRFEAMNRNGVGSVADLKEKRMWGTLKDFERPGIGRSKGRMVGRRKDKDHWRCEISR